MKLHNWENFGQKAIKAKTKMSLHAFSMFWEIDQRIARGKRLIAKTLDSSQKTFIKDFKAKKPWL